MKNYIVTMERKGRKTNYVIKNVSSAKEAINIAYVQAIEYSHVVACEEIFTTSIGISALWI